MRSFLYLLLASTIAPAAPAQMAEAPDHAPNCPADAEPLPTALAAWTKRMPLAAATSAAALATVRLAPGAAVDLRLAATPQVAYVTRPDHPGGSVSYGGMLAVHVARAGTIRVGIGSAAWIDVVDGSGKAVASIAHGQGPACSGIRKMVDFQLVPGDYVVEIAGNGTPLLPLIVAPLG